MPDFQKMYLIAAGAIADALDELDRLNTGTAKERLREALYHAEEVYISQGEDAGSPEQSSLRQFPFRLPAGRRLFLLSPFPPAVNCGILSLSKTTGPLRAERRNPWNSSA
ncbi:hypothetical protein [uncultured Oscillibacter sp.]|uniref:hypothetical protein n=1 Tax=uncultured Oscillibacter sp. TaxID=876091 RepID=UPI00260BFEBA|nr:hypothetical protein [uncultured Oscillibacter sp.]